MSPFGQWAPIVAIVVCLLVITTSLVQHVTGTTDPFIDNLAFAAFGLAIGAGGTAAVATNGLKTQLREHDQKINDIALAVKKDQS